MLPDWSARYRQRGRPMAPCESRAVNRIVEGPSNPGTADTVATSSTDRSRRAGRVAPRRLGDGSHGPIVVLIQKVLGGKAGRRGHVGQPDNYGSGFTVTRTVSTPLSPWTSVAWKGTAVMPLKPAPAVKVARRRMLSTLTETPATGVADQVRRLQPRSRRTHRGAAASTHLPSR